MVLIPAWERLAEALERVVLEGRLSKDDAEHDICVAIADQKIKVRPHVEFIVNTILDRQIEHHLAGEYRRYVRELRERTIPFDLPLRLKPNDFDWSQSCFKGEWAFEPGMPGFPGPPRHARVGIELFSSDVTHLFFDVEKLSKGNTQPQALTQSRGAKSRGISEAIDRLWPHGIPHGLSAKERDNAILAQMRCDGASIPSDPMRAIQRVLQKRRSQ